MCTGRGQPSCTWSSSLTVGDAALVWCGCEGAGSAVGTRPPGADLPEPQVPEGFRLVTWIGRVPDEHLAAYVDAREAMNDAPQPEGMEIASSTAETVRASEESLVHVSVRCA